MTAMSNSDFGKYVLELALKAPPFKPSATYDGDGDCIEFIASPEVYRAQRMIPNAPADRHGARKYRGWMRNTGKKQPGI